MQRDVIERNGNFSAAITRIRDGKPITLMKSLRTSDRGSAEQIQAKVNGIMTKVENGEKEIPPGVDLWDWLLKYNGEEKKVEKAKNETMLDSVINDFLAGRTKLAPNTQYLDGIYARHVRRFLSQKKSPFLPVVEATTELIKEYKVFRYAEGVGVKTVNMELAWLSTLCTDQKKHFPTNPLDEVVRDKNQAKFTRFRTAKEIEDYIEGRRIDPAEVRKLWKHRILTVAEIRDLLRLAKGKDEELYRMLAVSMFTGARRSEVARLRWLDVDFKTNYITITGMKGSRDDQYTSREIAMHPELTKALKAQHMVTRHSDYVFPAEDGSHVNPKLLHKRLVNLVKGTSFEDGGRWHMPRHSLASLMAAEGHDQRDIDGIIGHSTKAMADRYRHLMPQQKRAAVETLKAVKIG